MAPSPTGVCQGERGHLVRERARDVGGPRALGRVNRRAALAGRIPFELRLGLTKQQTKAPRSRVTPRPWVSSEKRGGGGGGGGGQGGHVLAWAQGASRGGAGRGETDLIFCEGCHEAAQGVRNKNFAGPDAELRRAVWLARVAERTERQGKAEGLSPRGACRARVHLSIPAACCLQGVDRLEWHACLPRGRRKS